MESRAEHLKDLGMVAYHNHQFDSAAERLQKVTEWSPDDWTTRLFLAVSYLKARRYNEARAVLIYIRQGCPSEHLRGIALNALDFIETQQKHAT